MQKWIKWILMSTVTVAVVFFVVRLLPENVKTWFRV